MCFDTLLSVKKLIPEVADKLSANCSLQQLGQHRQIRNWSTIIYVAFINYCWRLEERSDMLPLSLRALIVVRHELMSSAHYPRWPRVQCRLFEQDSTHQLCDVIATQCIELPGHRVKVGGGEPSVS